MKKIDKSNVKFIRNIIISLIALAIVTFILTVAPNYTRNEITDKINLIINNNNVTSVLKKDIFINEKGVIYLSKQDLANFFDAYIYYDEKYDQIITTSDTKVATLKIDEKSMTVNSIKQSIYSSAVKKDETYYLPFSEMNEVYNIEIEYIGKTNKVVVTSLNRKLEKADAAKNLSVKWKEDIFSRTVDKVKKGEKFVLISEDEEWAKVRTENGNIGYVKNKNLANKIVVRDEFKINTKLDSKVSIVWDYYSEYVSAPNRTNEKIQGINVVSPSFFILERLGKGEIVDNAKRGGQEYIKWAKQNGYKVWAMFSNDSMIQTTHEILTDYKLREKTINNIIDLATKYKVDGINLDFENMYEEDKDYYTRFVAELYPRLREYGMNLSVDVTAPDGSPEWSMCFERYDISENCDYIIFMAYDQYTSTSTSAGPTAGYDWVKVSLNKFLRDIESDKIILGIPFYTRIWRENSDGTLSGEPSVVNMKNIYNVVPSDAKITWDEDKKQNYAQYPQDGKIRKVWIEDEKSITEKLNLSLESNLAGVAFWAKDRENPNIWKVISEKMGI